MISLLMRLLSSTGVELAGTQRTRWNLNMKQCFPTEKRGYEATQLEAEATAYEAKGRCNEAKALIFCLEAKAISRT